MLVYLAHPVAGDSAGNFEKAKRTAREIVNRYPEVVPVSPVLNFCYFREPDERKEVMRNCFQLLAKCDELWLTGEWWNSNGCLQEKKLAEELGIPVKIYSMPPTIDMINSKYLKEFDQIKKNSVFEFTS